MALRMALRGALESSDLLPPVASISLRRSTYTSSAAAVRLEWGFSLKAPWRYLRTTAKERAGEGSEFENRSRGSKNRIRAAVVTEWCESGCLPTSLYSATVRLWLVCEV